MLRKLYDDFKESVSSVIPITLLVLVISFFIGISSENIISFAISSVLLILGITLFTFGADLSMVIIGDRIGDVLIRSRKLHYILFSALLIGFVITIAEPDLMVLASQLTSIPNLLIITLISFGVGLFLMIAFYRIIKGIPINMIIFISYLIILLLICFTPSSFLAISFDAGGVTTGPMGVPLLVAMGYGFTKLRSDKKARNDTFGLVGLASIGPIIFILILGLVFNVDSVYDTSVFTTNGSIIFQYLDAFYHSFIEIIIALTPILFVFLIFELFNNTLSDYDMRKVILGLIASLLGLTFFLTGANVGYMKIGYMLGSLFVEKELGFYLIILGMAIGYLIVKAEPAVKVLVEQISDLTEGSISKNVVNTCLSVGTCLAVFISLIRVFKGISILYFIVPGYIIALILAFITPDIFTAVAFDSGGAASGPLTSSFLLPICIGACMMVGGNILTDAFGILGMVSLSPLIVIQGLGVIYKVKMKKHHLRMVKGLDEEIIEYGVSL